MDNVKSFFHKERELEREPKKVPDAAVEVFEKPREHKIVKHELPKTEPSKPKRLPFSAAELRQKANAPPKEPLKEQPPEDISRQIAEFETAMSSMPGEDGSSLPLTTAEKPVETQSVTPQPDTPSLFNEFSKYLRERGVKNFDESKLSPEILSYMKAHHDHSHALERHEEDTSQLEQRVSAKLAELQGLEREWAMKQQEIRAAEKRLGELESSIQDQTMELRSLVSEFKHHAQARPELHEKLRKVRDDLRLDPEEYFTLHDGRILTSLNDLAQVLTSMDPSLYAYHVSGQRNDFADWVENVLKNRSLAQKFRAASSMAEARATISELLS